MQPELINIENRMKQIVCYLMLLCACMQLQAQTYDELITCALDAAKNDSLTKSEILFTFLIIYLILAVLCGFVVMVGELAIGRKTGKGAVAAYRSLSQRFKWVGWLGVASAFLIMSFYCALGGYCLKYVVLNIGNLTGAAFGSNGLSGSEVFGTFLTS